MDATMMSTAISGSEMQVDTYKDRDRGDLVDVVHHQGKRWSQAAPEKISFHKSRGVLHSNTGLVPQMNQQKLDMLANRGPDKINGGRRMSTMSAAGNPTARDGRRGSAIWNLRNLKLNVTNGNGTFERK